MYIFKIVAILKFSDWFFWVYILVRFIKFVYVLNFNKIRQKLSQLEYILKHIQNVNQVKNIMCYFVDYNHVFFFLLLHIKNLKFLDIWKTITDLNLKVGISLLEYYIIFPALDLE